MISPQSSDNVIKPVLPPKNIVDEPKLVRKQYIPSKDNKLPEYFFVLAFLMKIYMLQIQMEKIT